QHAGCELGRDGKLVCPRQGMAVDFRVEKAGSEDVARWIIQTLPFDALYFYGDDRPIHVSWSLAPSRRIYTLIETQRGRRPIPGLGFP
ncbi:MAG: hypothetical protein AAFX99_10530, partial [Myxococcota bacterium]